ncbi:DUF1127 domain-containing protein [Motiliproteus sp. MSK22-1]|uniref:DUF1127 domain-containing protein n=1 Tax=Motiliproteus sp. MSK22-1 TaxID=1897630 RepID=UPI0009787CCA|nr:DUF1127 domain-containing protein [Motiliproteus sp. MSK22-1]OMH33921.1 DUF1127 domain-containing protein [Motiliproteus sp. MSK22-1]
MLSIEFFRRLLALAQRLLRRYRTRKQLLTLCEHELKDIGISRSDALLEATKPFWRA